MATHEINAVLVMPLSLCELKTDFRAMNPDKRDSNRTNIDSPGAGADFKLFVSHPKSHMPGPVNRADGPARVHECVRSPLCVSGLAGGHSDTKIKGPSCRVNSAPRGSPIIPRLQSILVGPGAAEEFFLRPSPPDPPPGLKSTGETPACGGAPCVAAALAAAGGGTAPTFHRSASVAILGVAGDFAWGPFCQNGNLDFTNLQSDSQVRAVCVGPWPPA